MIEKTRPSYPDNWEEIRKEVLKRDSYQCCNDPSHKNTPLHVHHIVPISVGGTHHISNLKTICKDCHAKIHPQMNEHGNQGDWIKIMRKAEKAKRAYLSDGVEGDIQFAKLLEQFPDDGMVYFKRAEALEQMGDMTSAARDYELAEKHFPLDKWKAKSREGLNRTRRAS